MRKSTKKKIIVLLGLLLVFGTLVWFGVFRNVGKFNTLQAVPADAVFKVKLLIEFISADFGQVITARVKEHAV